MVSGPLAEELRERGLKVHQEVFVRGVTTEDLPAVGSCTMRGGCTVFAEEVSVKE